MSTQSLTFKSVSTRGFGANGNTRVVQLIDGMDNQAPGLNFPVGNVVGMSELDVESVVLLPGAASALYGPNAINGIILMNSKSPFQYQGLSASAKTGIMRADNRTKTNTPFYDFAIRYAKAFNNKIAFKLNASYLTAKDWQATDYRDQSLKNGTSLDNNNNNVLKNPVYDGVNRVGDADVGADFGCGCLFSVIRQRFAGEWIQWHITSCRSYLYHKNSGHGRDAASTPWCANCSAANCHFSIYF